MSQNITVERTVKGRLRFYFLTGIVVAAPLIITLLLIRTIINAVDDWVEPILPAGIARLAVPGLGLLLAAIVVTVLGALTANVVGRYLVGWGDRVVARVPLVGAIYRPVRQVIDSLMKPGGQSFREVVLVEFPGPGSETIAFITADAPASLGEDKVAVFLPTSPSIYTGFLLFMPRDQIRPAGISVETAIQLLVSAGLAANHQPERSNAAAASRSNR